MVTDVNEQIGEKPDDERGCERRDLKEGAAGQFVETEIEGQAAYSDNEDRADDEEIFTVVEIPSTALRSRISRLSLFPSVSWNWRSISPIIKIFPLSWTGI